MKTLITFVLLCAWVSISAQDVTFVGHRGSSYLAPENTIASLKLAWESGASAAECDILLTKDNKVIIFHDKKGERLTGHDFVVKDVLYNDIKGYPILLKESNLEKYEGETIPLLSEVLDILPENKTLVIEIKAGPEILPYMKEVISKHWNRGQIAFIAFDYETIVQTKAIYPEIPCFYLSAFRSDVKRKFNQISKSDLDGVNLRHKIINKKLVDKFESVGMKTWCWTVNDPEDARKLINDGVSAITTDRPVWLPSQL